MVFADKCLFTFEKVQTGPSELDVGKVRSGPDRTGRDRSVSKSTSGLGPRFQGSKLRPVRRFWTGPNREQTGLDRYWPGPDRTFAMFNRNKIHHNCFFNSLCYAEFTLNKIHRPVY